jgi:FkbM family methyltransferase
MLIFDIGAHHGEDSEYYLKKGFKVVAFECAPNNINYLKQLFESEIETGALVLETKAVISEGGNGKQVEFFVDEHSVWGTVYFEWSSRNSRLNSTSQPILVDTIDPLEIYSKHGLPFYMKIDVEGSDIDVLRSLVVVEYQLRPKFVSVESSKVSWKSLMQEFSIFKDLGYTKFAVVQQSRNHKKVSRLVAPDGRIELFRHKRHSSGPFGEDLHVKWMSYDKAIDKYRMIFVKYQLFGDDGIFSPRKIKLRFVRRLYVYALLILQLLPGWFDTHAMRE